MPTPISRRYSSALSVMVRFKTPCSALLALNSAAETASGSGLLSKDNSALTAAAIYRSDSLSTAVSLRKSQLR